MHPYEMGVILQAAAQRGEHQVPLWLALYGDRPAAAARLHCGARDRARWPPAGAHRLRDHRRRTRRAPRPGWPISSASRSRNIRSSRRRSACCRFCRRTRRSRCCAGGWKLIEQNSAVLTRRSTAIAHAEFAAAVSHRDRIPARAAQGRAAFRRRADSAHRERLGAARSVARHSPGSRGDNGQTLSRIRRRADELRKLADPDDAGTSPGPRNPRPNARSALASGTHTQSTSQNPLA